MNTEETYDIWWRTLAHAVDHARLGTVEARQKELGRVQELAARCLGLLNVIRDQEAAAGRRDGLTIAR
jgi:hypothetical protein